MVYIREWREARGLTIQQLADAIGRDKSVVSKFERGKSGLTEPVIEATAAALHIEPRDLYQLPPGDTPKITLAYTPAASTDPSIGVREAPRRRDMDDLVSSRPDLPIYASAQGGPSGMTVDLESPIAWVKRPEPLFNVSRGFGMYVVGDSMEPVYRQGDMVLVHPNKPANAGDDVLVVKISEDSTHDALVKTLVSTNSDVIRLKQYNPAKRFDVPRGDVHGLYLIVGKYHRR